MRKSKFRRRGRLKEEGEGSEGNPLNPQGKEIILRDQLRVLRGRDGMKVTNLRSTFIKWHGECGPRFYGSSKKERVKDWEWTKSMRRGGKGRKDPRRSETADLSSEMKS